MAQSNERRNQYNSTPRKVFDKALDRVEVRRQRDREDHRIDIAALLARLRTLEALFTNYFPIEEEDTEEL